MTLKKLPSDPGVYEVAPEGYIQAQDIPDIGQNPLAGILGAAWESGTLAMDFSKVTGMGSAGLGWLIQTHRAIKGGGGRLVCHSFKPMVLQQLNLIRADLIISIAPNRAAALRLLSSTSAPPA